MRSPSVNTGHMNIRVAAPVRTVNGPLRPFASVARLGRGRYSTAARRSPVQALRACPARWTGPVAVSVDCMGNKRNGELEGQSSINELLDQPVGDKPIQLPLPFHLQVRPGEFRRAS